MTGAAASSEALVVITLDEDECGPRATVHGVRFERSMALELARQVASDQKAAIEAELKRGQDSPFEPLTIVETDSGFVLLATGSYPYARIEVRTAPCAPFSAATRESAELCLVAA
ncbi:hypothetical protein BSFA1_80900 (plasmid) [Burkholderia sp. SFA1]|nr:hypothetical protein BYI23_E001840 [Burkholderia sp. YI23]BBQ02962.1 hypothetical protein BSFA1_80900 [Burkholderia sp. SFA1]